jgi:solute carrier family 25 (mitochondrial carnitine/acylcarnitine transporter), member 20/29
LIVLFQVQYNSPGSNARYSGPLNCLRVVTSELGLSRGIYRGWLPTALCRMSNYSYFGTYEFMRRYLSGDTSNKLSLGPSVLAGATAGVAYWLSCYPLDVMKNRIMAGKSLFFFFFFLLLLLLLLLLLFLLFLLKI